MKKLIVLMLIFLSACSIQTPVPPMMTKASTAMPRSTETTPPPVTTHEVSAALINPVDGAVMVYVPEGEFRMGSDYYINERPIHSVYLDAFGLYQTEVTNALFAKFVEDTGQQTEAEKDGDSYIFQGEELINVQGANWQHPQGPDSDLTGLDKYPVVHVSWQDAAAYCEWAGGRLPTEAEWEKAARGTEGKIYPWGNQPAAGNLANFADRNTSFSWADAAVDDGYSQTAPAGSYPDGASPYNALDMSGNVWEWVADWYASDYYENTPAENPAGPESGTYRILRGGSWHNVPSHLRTAHRLFSNPENTYSALGFRCALSLP